MDQEVFFEYGTMRVGVRPTQGATISTFEAAGIPIFFPDTMLPVQGGLKRRGGMPLLFPNAGPLTEANEYGLPQHGFLRDGNWEITAQTADSLELDFAGPNKTAFPFEAVARLRLSLSEKGFSYVLSVMNTSKNSLTVAPGLHPYFAVPFSKRSELRVNVPGFSAATYDWSEVLRFDRVDPIEIIHPEGHRIVMSASANFQKIVVWSEPERDFVCVEPWVGFENAMLHTEKAVTIQSGAEEVFTCIVSVETKLA